MSFDLTKIKQKLNDDGINTELPPLSGDPADYVVMPEWWEETYGVMGLPLGHVIQIAGSSDSGKTSLSMEAMRNAQEQGFVVVYMETEGKTKTNDMLNWGVDPENVVILSEQYTEPAFDACFNAIDSIKASYPDAPILFVFDSYGNTISLTEQDNSMSKESRVGGTAKVNRKAINILKAKMKKYGKIVTLFVNYNYDNIGSVGKTEAGGQALRFFSSLIIQSARTGNLESQVKGKKVKRGVKVKWTTVKNHLAFGNSDNYLPKFVELTITDDGFTKKD